MKTTIFLAAGLAVAGMLTGCESPPPPGVEQGPHHTIAYDVLVEASPPGARIEADGSNLGNTPVHVKIFGDRDGTFHDFGSYTYIIRAFPIASNQYPQIRVFGTGKGFTHEDRVPQRVYFEMNQPPPSYPPNGPGYAPGYGYPDYYYYGYPYYGYPYYYYGYPYFYGPAFRFYYGPRYYHRR
jgi:hypothetical protein